MKFYSVSLSLWAASAVAAVAVAAAASTSFHAATAVKIDRDILLHRSLQEVDNNTTDTDTAETTDCQSIRKYYYLYDFHTDYCVNDRYHLCYELAHSNSKCCFRSISIQ